MRFPSLPEYPPLWPGGGTNDRSWSAAYFNGWLLARFLVACAEWLAVDVAHHPWLLLAIGGAVLAWRWAPHPWWRLSTAWTLGLLVVVPQMPWAAGAAAGNSVIWGLLGWALGRLAPALPAGRSS